MNRTIGRRGAALLAAAAVAASLAGHGPASAQSGKGEPMMLPEPTTSDTQPRREGVPMDSYVAEVVDSTFFVGPAEFFALDLPTTSSGAQATHLFGAITATGKRDIIVRVFSGDAYDRWLKKRGGSKAVPFYVSPKARVVNLDQELPAGSPVVLLLDNGYSIRTPKRVHCQLQIQYRRGDGAPVSRATESTGATPTAPVDDVVPTPRSNDEEDTPPPPPPPPDSGN